MTQMSALNARPPSSDKSVYIYTSYSVYVCVCLCIHAYRGFWRGEAELCRIVQNKQVWGILLVKPIRFLCQCLNTARVKSSVSGCRTGRLIFYIDRTTVWE